MNFFFLNSIKFKFTLWYLTILATVLIVLGIGIYLTLSKSLHRNLDRSLMVRAEQITTFRDVIAIIGGGTFEAEPGELLSFYYYANDQLMDVSPKGRKVPVDTTWINRIIDGETGFSDISTDRAGNYRLYSIPFTPENTRIRLDTFTPQRPPRPPQKMEKRPEGRDATHQEIYKPENGEQPPPPGKHDRRPRQDRQPNVVEIDRAALIVARSTRDMDIALSRLLRILLLALPITLILAGGGGIFLLKIILNPVEKITQTAREIEEHDLSKRIEVTTKDELGRLSSTLNLMIERLEKAFMRQKELTGDASHELRAPLAVIQAEATLALQQERDLPSYQKSLEIIAQESDHMSGIIKQLLTLARADSGKEHTVFQKLDLSLFLKILCEDVDILCREKSQALHMKHSGQVFIKGDKNLLRNLMLNLLRNAIQYTAEGGEISVSLGQKKDMAIISVSDTGIGIPPQALPHIFNRFYRVDKARSRESGGSGLGLAICKYIVDSHSGTFQVTSQVNEGSTFIVKFPIA